MGGERTHLTPRGWGVLQQTAVEIGKRCPCDCSAVINIEKIAELCQDKKHDKTSNGAAYGVYDVMKGGYKNGFSNTRKTPACRSRRGLPGFDARHSVCHLPG